MSQSPFDNSPGNPYQSPQSSGAVESKEDDIVSRRVVFILMATRPWVRFLSILGFVTAGLMIVGGLLMGLFVGMQGELPMIVMAGVYVLIGTLYFFGAMYLGRYASAITQLSSARTLVALENALATQHTFWKYTGMLTAIVTCIYVGILVLALIAGLATTLPA